MKCLLFPQQKRGEEGVEEMLEEIVEERQRGVTSRCAELRWVGVDE